MVRTETSASKRRSRVRRTSQDSYHHRIFGLRRAEIKSLRRAHRRKTSGKNSSLRTLSKLPDARAPSAPTPTKIRTITRKASSVVSAAIRLSLITARSLNRAQDGQVFGSRSQKKMCGETTDSSLGMIRAAVSCRLCEHTWATSLKTGLSPPVCVIA